MNKIYVCKEEEEEFLNSSQSCSKLCSTTTLHSIYFNIESFSNDVLYHNFLFSFDLLYYLLEELFSVEITLNAFLALIYIYFKT